ncbi:uncharacterized protein LOC108679369 isoform X10 [Hyalella azteca]|uniref:Uncharacterized protein LOC108679369 isoform X10 n=1 Tax=Hyalella azteca TaxID=294128 RepID=A0A979FLB6_HYAAZ|nr:uncharacterized protein LOC108679369 isoform X10 [Hyalella azteca]
MEAGQENTGVQELAPEDVGAAEETQAFEDTPAEGDAVPVEEIKPNDSETIKSDETKTADSETIKSDESKTADSETTKLEETKPADNDTTKPEELKAALSEVTQTTRTRNTYASLPLRNIDDDVSSEDSFELISSSTSSDTEYVTHADAIEESEILEAGEDEREFLKCCDESERLLNRAAQILHGDESNAMDDFVVFGEDGTNFRESIHEILNSHQDFLDSQSGMQAGMPSPAHLSLNSSFSVASSTSTTGATDGKAGTSNSDGLSDVALHGSSSEAMSSSSETEMESSTSCGGEEFAEFERLGGDFTYYTTEPAGSDGSCNSLIPHECVERASGKSEVPGTAVVQEAAAEISKSENEGYLSTNELQLNMVESNLEAIGNNGFIGESDSRSCSDDDSHTDSSLKTEEKNHECEEPNVSSKQNLVEQFKFEQFMRGLIFGSIPEDTPVLPENTADDTPVLPENTTEEAPVLPENTTEEAPVLPENTSEDTPVLPVNSIEEAPVLPENTSEDTPVLPENTTEEAPVLPENTSEEAPVLPENTSEDTPVLPVNSIEEGSVVPGNITVEAAVILANTTDEAACVSETHAATKAGPNVHEEECKIHVQCETAHEQKPEITVLEQKTKTSNAQMPRPETFKQRRSEHETNIRRSEPEASVRRSEPEASVRRSEPATNVQEVRISTNVRRSEPATNAQEVRNRTNVRRSEPKTSERRSENKTSALGEHTEHRGPRTENNDTRSNESPGGYSASSSALRTCSIPLTFKGDKMPSMPLKLSDAEALMVEQSLDDLDNSQGYVQNEAGGPLMYFKINVQKKYWDEGPQDSWQGYSQYEDWVLDPEMPEAAAEAPRVSDRSSRTSSKKAAASAHTTGKTKSRKRFLADPYELPPGDWRMLYVVLSVLALALGMYVGGSLLEITSEEGSFLDRKPPTVFQKADGRTIEEVTELLWNENVVLRDGLVSLQEINIDPINIYGKEGARARELRQAVQHVIADNEDLRLSVGRLWLDENAPTAVQTAAFTDAILENHRLRTQTQKLRHLGAHVPDLQNSLAELRQENDDLKIAYADYKYRRVALPRELEAVSREVEGLVLQVNDASLKSNPPPNLYNARNYVTFMGQVLSSMASLHQFGEASAFGKLDIAADVFTEIAPKASSIPPAVEQKLRQGRAKFEDLKQALAMKWSQLKLLSEPENLKAVGRETLTKMNRVLVNVVTKLKDIAHTALLKRGQTSVDKTATALSDKLTSLDSHFAKTWTQLETSAARKIYRNRYGY